jgi:uncharacterized protein YoxC
MLGRELCITYAIKYISTPLIKINFVFFVVYIATNLSSVVEKIDLGHYIKNKLPICRLIPQTGKLKKKCSILYEHPHKRFTKEIQL